MPSTPAPLPERPLGAPPRALWLLVIIPAIFVAANAVLYLRNIVFWDEFDTVLHFLTQLKTHPDLNTWWHEITGIQNGHRMVTSRLLTAVLWKLTGTVDFRWLGMIGNLYLGVLYIVLVQAAPSGWSRLRLGLGMGLLLFQLQHYESLFWSGSSIDHFHVPLLVAIALRCLTVSAERPLSWARWWGGLAAASAASFTLAHGLVVLPLGLVVLVLDRRHRAAVAWAGVSAIWIALYFHDFSTGSISGQSAGILNIVGYALALLGAPIAQLWQPGAPIAGIVLLGGLGTLIWHHRDRRRLSFFPAYAGWLVTSIGLIAYARASSAGPPLLSSRYLILPCLLWALAIYGALELRPQSHQAARRDLGWAIAALLVFNLTANALFRHTGASWATLKAQAVRDYYQTGTLDRTPFPLFNQPRKGQCILTEAAEAGIYRLPTLTREVPDSEPAEPAAPDRIVYYIDEARVTNEAVIICGWAAGHEVNMSHARLRLVLASPGQGIRLFDVQRVPRDDVARALDDERARESGFSFVLPRDELPTGDYRIGIVLRHGDKRERIMTDTWVRRTTQPTPPIAL